MIEQLIANLMDDNLKVRFDAAKELGELRAEQAFEPLVKVLHDNQEHSHVRGQAAIALGRLGDITAFEPLLQSLKDADEHVAGNAKVAIMSLIVAKPDESVPYLIAALEEDAAEVRVWASDTLGYYIDSALTLEPLLQALNSAKPTVEEAAIQALSYHDKPSVISRLLLALEDTSPKIRYNVALTLGEIGNSHTLPTLHNLEQSDPDPNVRKAATYATERIRELRDS